MGDTTKSILCALLTGLFIVPPQSLVFAGERPAADPTPRATILDLSGLDTIDAEPTTGTVLYAREDLVVGEGEQAFHLVRSYVPWAGNAKNTSLHWVSALDLRLDFQPEQRLAAFTDADGFVHYLRAEAGSQVYRALEGRAATLAPSDEGFRLAGLGDERVYVFDVEGRLLERRGPASCLLSYRYDREDRLETIEGPWGLLRLVRDARGILERVEAPGDVVVRYRRDEAGNLIEAASGAVYEPYTYDEAGRLTSVAGGQAFIDYDAHGRVAGLRGAGIAPVTLRYLDAVDPVRGIETRVERGGLAYSVFVSPDGRRIERTTPAGLSHITELDARQRPVSLRVGTLEWTWHYDARGRVASTTAPEGETVYEYGSKHTDRPTRITLPDEREVRFLYDARGNVRKLKTPGQGTIRYEYDAQGRVSAVIDPRGAATRIERDARGFVVAVEEAGIGVTRIRRGPAGEVRAVRGPDGRVTRLAADQDGRHLKVVDKQGLIYEAHYDLRGQLIRFTDELGQTTRYTWDARGNMLEAHDDQGLLARFSYDAAGRMTSITDAGGSTVRYERPDARTLRVDDPSAGRREMRFDAYGRITDELKGKTHLRFAYDAQGRLVRRETPRGSERYDFDAFGRIRNMSGPDGGFAFRYDGEGRLAALENLTLGQQVEYRYDAAGDRAAMKLPWGVQRYERDEAGRVRAIVTPAGERIRFDLLKDGRREAIHYPNGTTTRFSYDRSHLTRVETRRGKTLLDLRAYDYDDRGRVARITDAKGRVTELKHDARGRLTQAVSSEQDLRYRYDAAGNRVAEKRDRQVLRSEVGEGNRILRQGERSFEYGPTGVLSAARGPEGVTRYRYDHDEHLVGVELPTGETVRYGYAPNGQRLWRQGPEGRTDFLHDLADVVGEYAGSELETSFVHGPELDDVLAARHGGEDFYYHYDLVRSVTSISDDAGRVAARYRYDPFGQQVQASGPATAWNPFRYTSRAFDAATGLYHYRARSYDPGLGRFTSPDPMGREGGLNTYAYCGNDPSLFNDPYGLWPAWLDRRVQKAKNWVRKTARNVVRVAKKVANVAYKVGKAYVDTQIKAAKLAIAFGKGFAKGLWSGAKGIYNMVRHPVQTFQAMKWAVQNMDKVKAALGAKWEEYKDAFFNDPEKFMEMTGVIAGEITIGLVGTKGLDKLAKVGAVAKVAQAAARTRPIQAVARTGQRIAQATAPIRRAAAPVLRPVARTAEVATRPVRWAVKTAMKPFDLAAEGIVRGTGFVANNAIVKPVRRLVGAVRRGGPRTASRARPPAVAPRGTAPRTPTPDAPSGPRPKVDAPETPTGPRTGGDTPTGPRTGGDTPTGPRTGGDTPTGPRSGDTPSGPRTPDGPDAPATSTPANGSGTGANGSGAHVADAAPLEANGTGGMKHWIENMDGPTGQPKVTGSQPTASAGQPSGTPRQPTTTGSSQPASTPRQPTAGSSQPASTPRQPTTGSSQPRTPGADDVVPNRPNAGPVDDGLPGQPRTPSQPRRTLTGDDPVFNTRLGSSDKVGDFSDIAGQPVDEIISRIPAGAKPRRLHPQPGKVTDGWEWKWKDADGVTNKVRIHGPDGSAPPGSNANQGWVARVERGGKVLDSDGNWQPRGIYNERSPNFNEELGNSAHIPVEGNPAAPPRAPRTPTAGTPNLGSSKNSLDDLLDDVWSKQDELAGSGYRPIYRMYNATDEANALSRARPDYVDDLANIARERPAGATSNAQGFGGNGNAIDDLANYRRSGELGDAMNGRMDNTFYRYERADWDPSAIRERVYINANADTAPELMNKVVKELVDNPNAYPGVEMAKISGPGAVGNRAENIVIYTRGGQSTQDVVDAVRRMQDANPGWFNTTTPRMTQPVAPGVATGAEPVRFAGQESFGSARAKAISEALEETRRAGGTRADFDANVRDSLRRYGVDPDNPHMELP